MQRRNRYIVTLVVSAIGCACWLVWLKDFANYAIAHPLVTNLIGVFVLAVGGGIIVSQIPSIVWKSFSSEEDEITGETE